MNTEQIVKLIKERNNYREAVRTAERMQDLADQVWRDSQEMHKKYSMDGMKYGTTVCKGVGGVVRVAMEIFADAGIHKVTTDTHNFCGVAERMTLTVMSDEADNLLLLIIDEHEESGMELFIRSDLSESFRDRAYNI